MNNEINLNEEFGRCIYDTVLKYNLRKNIEIGSWDGAGSTKCFVDAMTLLDGPKRLVCIEIEKSKIDLLIDRYKNLDFVEPVNCSSIGYIDMLCTDCSFFSDPPFNKLLTTYSPDTVMSWFDRDIELLKHYPDGALNNLMEQSWDSVLIDGGEFTGYSEFRLVKDKVNVIFLDDTHKAFKCAQAYTELILDPEWELISENPNIRNGYAIFRKI